MGPDKLEAEPEGPKAFLSVAEDRRLTVDMKELYHELLPSQESEERRRRLVEKLELVLRKQWPEHTIKVNVFGSTGNKLGTTDSDVDICITTDCKELEQVCVLADILANQGGTCGVRCCCQSAHSEDLGSRIEVGLRYERQQSRCAGKHGDDSDIRRD